MATDYGNKSIVTDELVFCVDPANKQSWTGPNSSTTYNVVGTHTGSIFNDTSGSYGDNSSFDFDGTDDYIDTTTTTLGDKYSVSFWFKNSVTPSPFLVPLGANTLGGYVILLGATTGYWYYGNASSARASVIDSAYTAAMSDTSNWHHLVLVRNAPTNGTALYSDGEVYLDGALIFTEVNKYVGTTVSSVKNIGDVASGTSYSYNGNIGPIQIYTRALSASEVLQNYNALKSRFE